MACIAHHFFLRYCPPPMNFTFMVSDTDVSFGNNNACIVHFKHDHGMGIVVYPQDISDFYIFKCKLTCFVHPGWQTAKRLIAEYKSKSYAAHGTNIMPIKSPTFPTVISLRIRIRLIVGPSCPLPIPIPLLQCNHSLIDFRRDRKRIITGCRPGYRLFRKNIRMPQRFFLPCMYH